MNDDHRVRWEGGESDGDEVQSIWGGSSRDIERSILADTYVNTRILQARIVKVGTIKGALGAGQLNELALDLDNGHRLVIRGPNLEVIVE